MTIGDGEVAALLRDAAWLPGDARRAGRCTVLDRAELAPGTLLVVAAVSGPDGPGSSDGPDGPSGCAAGRRFGLPVTRAAGGPGADGGAAHGGWVDAHGTPGFGALVAARAAAGAWLRTERGGVVEFRGTGRAPARVRELPFAPGWSSNSLALLAVDGVPHVHKTYRLLDAGVREPELLRRLSGTGRTPGWAGDYTYVDPVDGSRHPLGVLYRHAAGEGLDGPLRECLRGLWRAPEHPAALPAATAEELMSRQLAPLEVPLRAAGEFLAAFHRDLAGRLGGGTPPVRYPVDEVLDRTRGRLAAARPFAVGLPGAARAAAADSLDAELDSVEAELAGPRAGLPAAGPCHGDLHLSHLIHRPGDTPGGPWRMTVIDLSTPALDPGDPAWAAQSPLEDTVAVRRALEYFTADEAAFEAARLLGIDQLDAMRGALDGAPGLPPDQRALLRGVFAVADAWRDRVLGLLLGPPDRTPLGRLLYVRRLLHELDYNCAHDRPYHAAIDLRHALDGRSTARLPAHPAGPAAASVSASASASANSPARKRP